MNWAAEGTYYATRLDSIFRAERADPDCKTPRATPGQGYLEALTQPNTKVISTGIERVVENGIVSRDGELHEVDVVIAATGYDTSYIPRFPVVGLSKVNLQDKWRKEGAAAYLSCAVPGFPNYFCEFCPKDVLVPALGAVWFADHSTSPK